MLLQKGDVMFDEKQVNKLFNLCVIEGIDKINNSTGCIIVNGLDVEVAFNQKLLEKNKEEIKKILLKNTDFDKLVSYERSIEKLMLLGLGIDMVQCLKIPQKASCYVILDL